MPNYCNPYSFNTVPKERIRTYQVLTPSAIYPVSLTEAKEHLKQS